MDVFEILNTRELSFLIWLSLLFCSLLFIPAIRREIAPMMKIMFQRNFLIIYILAGIYTATISIILYGLGTWDNSLIKDTAVWFLFAAFPMMYGSARAKDLGEYFTNTLKSLLTVTVVLEFLMGLHTFSFWIELLIVPFSLFLVALTTFAKQKPEHHRVQVVLEWFGIILGMVMVITEFSYVIDHFSEFARVAYLKQFFLPIELSIMFIPFLYGLVTYMRFQETFVVLSLRFRDNPHLSYTKGLILWEFYNNLKGLQRWRQYIFRIHPKTKAEIKNSIKEIQQLQRTEKDPPIIPLSNGWSPYLAKDFLKNIGLHTEHYIHYYDDEWGVTSNNLHLSEDLLANDVNYTINGNRQAATLLKLRLIVFDLSKKANAHDQFLYYVNCLWTKIFSEMVTEDIEMAILDSKNLKYVKTGYMIEVEFEPFNTTLKGYELEFKIIHPKHQVSE